MIYSYRHSKHWSNVQPWNPPWESFSQTAGLIEAGMRLMSITTIKPDRAPARILTDTCEGIHPPFTSQYLRKVLKS
jgi:hypothetical protein